MLGMEGMGMDPAEDDTSMEQGYADVLQAVSTLPTQVTSQEQWDALPAWAKDLHRLQQSGIPLTQADVFKVAHEGIKTDRRLAVEGSIVELEDPVTGNRVPVLRQPSGGMSLMPKESFTHLERIVDENGFIRMVDKRDGTSRVITDAETGQPVRGQQRATAMDAVNAMSQQQDMMRIAGELGALRQRVAKDGPDKRVRFGGPTLGEEVARLEAQIQLMDPPAIQSPQMQEAAATFESPDAVADAFRNGNLSEAQAVQILRDKFGME